MSEIKYIDIHAHLNFPDYKDDLEEVVKRARDKGVAIINIGTDIDSSKEIIDIADNFRDIHSHIYSIPGIHPHKILGILQDIEPIENVTEEGELLSSDQKKLKILLKADEVIEKWLSELEKLSHRASVVGIGECGIDLFKLDEYVNKNDFKLPKEQITPSIVLALQAKLFIGQIKIALKKDIPIMIHARESYKEILEILDENFIAQGIKLKGNVHFFAGNFEEAKAFLDRGFTVSFTGVITFADAYSEVIAKLPEDRVMSETDCPFVAPIPYRGSRNEPSYVIEVVKKIAAIRGVEENHMANILLENAKKAFSLKI